MKEKTKLKIKYLYYIVMWLYIIIGGGIWIQYTSNVVNYILLMRIFFSYLILGGIISIIFKFNIFTVKIHKFSNVTRESFSWFMAIFYIILAMFLMVKVTFPH